MTKFCAEYSDFNPYKATIDVFRHGKIDLSKHSFKFDKTCAHLFIPSEVNGKLNSLQGANEVENLSSFLRWLKKPLIGQSIYQSTFLGDIPTEFIMANEDRAVLLHDMQQARVLLKYDVVGY